MGLGPLHPEQVVGQGRAGPDKVAQQQAECYHQQRKGCGARGLKHGVLHLAEERSRHREVGHKEIVQQVDVEGPLPDILQTASDAGIRRECMFVVPEGGYNTHNPQIAYSLHKQLAGQFPDRGVHQAGAFEEAIRNI